MTNGDIAVIEQQPGLPTTQELDETVNRATVMAQTLARIITEQNLSVQIGHGKHVQVEAWQTVGRFCGYVAQSEEQPCDGPGALARAKITRLSDGMVVSMATARCGGPGDEPWDKRASNHQGSMAQTRAVSKAFRNVLSWIVVLAGYEPTPYEEMPQTPDRAPKSATEQPPNLSSPTTERPADKWCSVHDVASYMRGAMPRHGHPLGETGQWCNETDNTTEAQTEIPNGFPAVPDPLASEEFLAYGINNLGWAEQHAQLRLEQALNWLKDNRGSNLHDAMLEHIRRSAASDSC